MFLDNLPQSSPPEHKESIQSIIDVIKQIFSQDIIDCIIDKSFQKYQLDEAIESLSVYELKIQDYEQKIEMLKKNQETYGGGFMEYNQESEGVDVNSYKDSEDRVSAKQDVISLGESDHL